MNGSACALLLILTAGLSHSQTAESSSPPSRTATDQEIAKPILVPAINPPHRPITQKGRALWFVKSTVGLQSLAGGVVSAGWGTAFNKPAEYRATWSGFGKRYGMRLTGVSTSNAMEAALSAALDEDPRYVRAPRSSFRTRVKRSITHTFIGYSNDGTLGPAYARYVAVSGSSFLSNAWRAESDRSAKDALTRIGLGFLGRMASNAFSEFWPDLRQRMQGGGAGKD